MLRFKYCPDLDFDYYKHIGVKRRITMNARMRRRRRCLNWLFLAAAATTFLAPSLINADTDNVSFYGLSGQKVEHVITDDTYDDIKRKVTVPLLAGYIGRTNSVMTSQFTITDVSYTGSWAWVDDTNGNFRIRFLTSGTFTPAKTITIDVFLVGGGAGGANRVDISGAAGGGSGRTATAISYSLVANHAYVITIGAGGGAGANGGTTIFGDTGYSANGGSTPTSWYNGGNGGSGGGAGGASAALAGGNGGFNGSNGGGSPPRTGGNGQGTPTYEFGNASLPLYAGAGGGGANVGGAAGTGGPGGGANGGAAYSNGSSASANTGGGGGGAGGSSTAKSGGLGGSGICVIRNHR